MNATVTLRLGVGGGEYTLHLPQDEAALDRQLTSHGILTGASNEYRVVDISCRHPALLPVLRSAGTIDELNFIARRTQDFDGLKAGLFVKIWEALGGGIISAVNLAVHYDSLQLHSGITTLRELGCRYLELAELPSDGLGDYHLTEYGKLVRDKLAGVFVGDRGFVGFPPGFRKEGYDGHSLPQAHDEDTMLLRTTRPIYYRSSSSVNQWDGVHNARTETAVPLSASAAMVSRALERVGAASVRDGVTFLYPLYCGEPDVVITGERIGEIAGLAMRYRNMTGQQRQVFRQLIREADIRAIEESGDATPYPSLIRQQDIMGKMEREHGLPPVEDTPAPVDLIVQNSRDKTKVTGLTLPASSEELERASGRLGLDSLADPDCQIRCFGLGSRCETVLGMLDQCASLPEMNEWARERS